MITIELSKFKLAHPYSEEGPHGISQFHSVVPISGDTSSVSEQARLIHEALITRHAETGEPMLVRDIIKTHGFWDRSVTVKTLRGFPVEELRAASLLYVVEEAQNG